MSILIEKVRVRNFRSLRNLEVDLSPNVTLLVGANNAGKSTFLRALGFALNTDRRFISQDDLFIDKTGKPLPPIERVITIDVKIVPANGANDFDDQWASVFGTEAKPNISGQNIFAFRTKIDFGLSNKESQINRYLIVNWDSGNADENSKITADLSGIPFHFIDAQRDLQGDLQSRTSHFGQMTSKIEYDDAQREALEGALAQLNQNAMSKSQVLSHLRTELGELNKTVDSKGGGVEITPFPKKIRDLYKGVKVHFQDGQSDIFSLEYHGMGTRSWASLLAFKAKISWDKQENRIENKAFFPVLGLEEPEAHLHPNAQRQVYQQLCNIQGQKIISTHSPYIVAQAELSEIRHFYKETDETIVSAVNIKNLKSDENRKIKREVMNTRGELLFAKVVILSEGETEEQALPIWFKKYWNCFPFEKGVIFIGCGGSNYKAFLTLVQTFKIPWFIFSDYDTLGVKKDVKSAGKHVGINNVEKKESFVLIGQPLEKELISNGYQNELKQAIIRHITPEYKNENHKKAKKQEVEQKNTEIMAYTDYDLSNYLINWKTKLAPIYAEIITELPDSRCIPPKIQKLFDTVSKVIGKPVIVSIVESSNAIPE